jgi:SSS family transporter
MNWLSEHAFLLLLVAGYTALMLKHALDGRRATRGMTDFYVGGRSMGGFALGVSFFATYSSTNSFVGFSGQAYAYGAPWLLLAPCAVLFSLLAWIWIAPKLRSYTGEVGAVTIPEFMGRRYRSGGAQVSAALIVIFASFLYMVAVFKGIGNLLQTFLDVPYVVAIGIVFGIVVLYTAFGGFISVVKTDVVQGLVMLAAAFFLFIGTTRAAGGLGTIRELQRSVKPELFQWDAAMPFLVLIGIIVAGTMKFMVEPRQLSRFFALEDERARRSGMVVSTLLFLVVYSLLVPIGLYAHAVIAGPIDDTDLIVPTLIADTGVFHPAIGAVLLVAMIAAAMSSLDSVLLVLASSFERDIIQRWAPTDSDQRTVARTRVYVAVFALITAILALRPIGGIVTLTAFSGSLYAACFFPALVLGLHSARGRGPSALASFAVGLGILLVWPLSPLGASIHQVFPALLLSTVVFWIVAQFDDRHAPLPIDSRQ